LIGLARLLPSSQPRAAQRDWSHRSGPAG